MTTEFQPIAIVGIGCRFPGECNDPESFWQLLESGHDAIRLTPDDRWNLEKFYAPGHARPGKTQSKWGGYVEGLDRFDPQLFGIAPREAACMDPQQRMLLETAYRAIEDAGVSIESIAGQPVSVHVGISGIDYSVAALSHQDRGVIGPYSNTGGSSSIAANRISYCFDLRGESIAVDTACSSSLIALHLACRTLQNQANTMALAGGVNALIMPDFYVAFSQLGVLSPDGRCKTFDASANGYVRSEGAGMVLLKRLEDAAADGDSIYAVIRGSATNQDGRTEGLTVPSQPAQQALIETALATAGVDGSDISYVEAHGTGTPIGDPIEARAIASCYGRPGPHACHVGSVKTNIGHLEAGAGIASLIKVALAMRHQKIPAHLNYQTPNPQIDFDAFGLRVPTSTQAWNADGTRLAGINGFGYGGANVHLIVGEASEKTAPKRISRHSSQRQSSQRESSEGQSTAFGPSPATDAMLLPISAHSPASLGQTAALWAVWLEQSDESIENIVANACHRRSHHDWRAAMVAGDRNGLVERLRELSNDPDGLASQVHSVGYGHHTADAPKVAFVCSGQGPQWWAMGRQLLQTDQVFRDVIARCESEFSKHVTWSLCEEMSRDKEDSRMQETSIAQPCLFALQVALAAVWESKGIVPAVVVGHSVGEIAAAYLSGSLRFSDACLVAIHRGRTMDAASSKGAMIAVGLSVEEAKVWIQDVADRVSIAAVNGPTSLTVSGCAESIGDLRQRLDQAGIFCRPLQVEYAFHSPQMDPVRDELLRSLASICPTESTTTMISTVTGIVSKGTEFDAEYWWKNVRERVRFADAMEALAGQQVEVAIEIGPHPVLAYAIAECFSEHVQKVFTVPSLRRDTDDQRQIKESLGRLFVWGFPVDWNRNAPVIQSHVNLPPLVMNRQPLWSESYESKITRLAPDYDSILGDPLDGPDRRWQTHVDLRVHESLSDHCVRNTCVMPAATMLQFAAAAAKQVRQSESVSLRGFQLQNPCLLSDGTPIRLQVSYDEDRRRITLSNCGLDDSEWQDLAIAELSGTAATELRTMDLESLRSGLSDSVSAERIYDHCERLGLNYGRRFRGVIAGHRKPCEAIVSIDSSNFGVLESDPLSTSSALLDSCFHGMIVADPDFEDTVRGLYLPQRIDSLDIFAKGASRLTAHVRIVRKDDFRMIADIDIFDDSNQHCIAIRGFESVCVSGTSAAQSADDLLYRYVWKPSDRSEPANASDSPRKWLLFSDQSGTGSAIASRFPVSDRVITVQHGTSFKRLQNDSFIIEPDCRQQLDRLLTDVGDGVTDIVYLWGLDSPDNVELSNETLDKSTLLTTIAPMHLAAAWQAAADANLQTIVARLFVVTRSAQPPDDAIIPISIATGPLVGFGRVITSECARLATRLIDLQSDEKSSNGELLRELVQRCDREDEVMIRDSIRWVRRFVPANETPLHQESGRRTPAILRQGHAASIDQLRYETTPAVAPKPNEIEIEIVATGLNFSDVMKSLDLYPGLPDGPVQLGAECSGRVRRVGSDVADFCVGDEVIAVAPGSFGTHVIVKASLVAKKPHALTHDEAATIPIAFLTAEYALNECARIRPGERVLIHAASGGVGIAATQLAQLAGAKVYATAGTNAKRQFVRESGVDAVMDSRTLDFARETLDHSGGQGVDVVLNSLPGEAIRTGLSILRTGGRFLEIGKRDIYSDSSLGLQPFKNNLALFAIDLDQLFREQPERMGVMLRELVKKFERGELQPLAVTKFDADETSDAFRFMQQGKHIGKVVVDYRGGIKDVFAGQTDPIRFKSDRSYWVAGGLGGFGLRVAQWLIDCGAKQLILGGRSSTFSDQTKAVLNTWTAQGIDVRVMPVDLTSIDSVQSVVAKIDAECAPLTGVFHTAMILEDRLISDLDVETLHRVLRPKVLGGWNLHAATGEHDLDQFVLFSSLSSVFGHAGQANYAAANAFLDSLAHYRRSLGMPGIAINWGHVGEVGYLARRGELSQRLERQGVMTFSADEAMQCLEQSLQTDVIQQSVLRMDWTRWRGLGITGDVSPRFAHLLRGKTEELSTGQRLATADEVRSATPEARRSMIAGIIGCKAAALLGIELEQMPWDRPLLSLGLDSLMAVEMRNWIESRLSIDLPIADLMRSDGMSAVCAAVSERVAAGADQSELDSPQELLDQLPDLSDAAVDDLLMKLLEESGGEQASR